MLYFTLPNGVRRDAWIRAIDHYTQRDTEADTQINRDKEVCVIWHKPERVTSLSPHQCFAAIRALSNNIGIIRSMR